MLVKTYGAAVQGIEATIITIEVSVQGGRADFTLVGLPDSAIKESRERIAAVFAVHSWKMPSKSLTINMAPADIRKEGAAYDLPLAIGILAGIEEVRPELLEEFLIMGELSLDGTLQPIRGVLPIALQAKIAGFKGIILPEANTKEAAVVDGLQVYGMATIQDVVRFLNGDLVIEPIHIDLSTEFTSQMAMLDADFADVRGQENVKKALEIAAAGGHNVIMIGPPGAGKSMMAKRLPGILPPLTLDEALETTKIHSVAGTKAKDTSLVMQRPFRSPHHTVSDVALVGGGSNAMPGEISLAHNGVLFLDELPEYKKQVLEVLRQPLEDGVMTVARAKRTVTYPSRFMLIAAMNPCPCGHFNDPTHACTCTPSQIQKYMGRISGPLLDRIDIQCEIRPVPFDELKNIEPSESSAAIRERVIKARMIQSERFKQDKGIYCNAQMTPKMLRKYCILDVQCERLLKYAMEQLGLSARAYDRILKVARTMADLDEAENIQAKHISAAISFRNLDRAGYFS